MTNIDPLAACMGRNCEWSASLTELGCQNGAGDCYRAVFAKSSKSAFQDQTLQEATDKINDILKAIAPHSSKDIQLSIITTGTDIMLAWVNHKREPQKNDITSKSPEGDIVSALGII